MRPPAGIWFRSREDQAVHESLQLLVSLDFTNPESRTLFPFEQFRWGTAYGLAVRTGRAVGYVDLCDGDRDGAVEALTSLCVAHGHRRQGVATALLELANERPDVSISNFSTPVSVDAHQLGLALARKHERQDMIDKLTPHV